VAARGRTGLTADCTGLAIDPESGLLLQTRPAIGGNVMATIRTPDFRPQMATVRPRTFRIPDPTPRPGRIVRPELPEETFLSRIENLGLDAEEDRGADIQDKEVVISGGKGLRRPEGFALIRELAELLDAGVGASRPTVEAKWIPYPHQVGLSGRVVAPKLYLAAGISGAVQHLAGMQTARKIVAVNKDPEAPIFRVADLALCGDLYDILPRLAALIREERGNRRAR
jgi:electron transfer flavoprotein alpha subunit